MSYFKVVYAQGGRLYSFLTTNDDLQVEYKIGEWSGSKVGGLLVFDSFENAKRLRNASCWPDPSIGQIYSCECQESINLPKYRLSPEFMYIFNVISLWEYAHLVPQYILQDWPEGTLAFKRVKLLELIDKLQTIIL